MTDMADDTDTTRPGEAEAIEAALNVVAQFTECACALCCRGEARKIVARVYPVIAAAVREQAEAAAYEQGRRDAHGTIPARIAAAERAVREQAAQDIEAAWSQCEEWHAMHREPYTYGSAAAFAEHAVRLARGGR